MIDPEPALAELQRLATDFSAEGMPIMWRAARASQKGWRRCQEARRMKRGRGSRSWSGLGA
jgi:hypothetical protein